MITYKIVGVVEKRWQAPLWARRMTATVWLNGQSRRAKSDPFFLLCCCALIIHPCLAQSQCNWFVLRVLSDSPALPLCCPQKDEVKLQQYTTLQPIHSLQHTCSLLCHSQLPIIWQFICTIVGRGGWFRPGRNQTKYTATVGRYICALNFLLYIFDAS